VASIVDDSRPAWAHNFLSCRERQSQTKRGEFGREACLLKSESPVCKDSSGREQCKSEPEDLAGAKPVRVARMD
jgi:hypothetical protein